MNSLNSVLLEGNLIDNPSLKKIKGELPVCKFTIRSSRHFIEDGERIKEDSFFDIVVNGKQAEVCREYLEKDRGVRVIGRIKQDRWKDYDGMSHSSIHIVAEHVEFKPVFKQRGKKRAGDRKEEALTILPDCNTCDQINICYNAEWYRVLAQQLVSTPPKKQGYSITRGSEKCVICGSEYSLEPYGPDCENVCRGCLRQHTEAREQYLKNCKKIASNRKEEGHGSI